MAKKANPPLTRAADAEPNEITATATRDESRMVMIEVPVGTEPGYASPCLRDLSRRNAAALANVAAGLRADEASLQNGRAIESSDDALAWILERITAAATPGSQ
jgi:hypothetical protein